jgi:hypothetical protein
MVNAGRIENLRGMGAPFFTRPDGRILTRAGHAAPVPSRGDGGFAVRCRKAGACDGDKESR